MQSGKTYRLEQNHLIECSILQYTSINPAQFDFDISHAAEW